MCPGKAFADATDTLAVFEIKKVVEYGSVVEPVVEFLPGAISHLKSYMFDLRARSGGA